MSRDAPPRRIFHNGAHIRRDLIPMPKLALEIAVAAALTLAAILSLAASAHANEIMVTGAYARASASASAKAGAVYFTIVNHGAEADRIVGASSDAAASAMLHESAISNGIATMRMVEIVELASGAELSFAPGGSHVMLVGLKRPLKQGEHFTLTLKLERAGDIAVDVPVAGVAASTPP
jgi:periplasmic copper chaperone A